MTATAMTATTGTTSSARDRARDRDALKQYKEILVQSDFWARRGRAVEIDEDTDAEFTRVTNAIATSYDAAMVRAELALLDAIEGLTVHEVRAADLWGLVIDRNVGRHADAMERLTHATTDTAPVLLAHYRAYKAAAADLRALSDLVRRWDAQFHKKEGKAS